MQKKSHSIDELLEMWFFVDIVTTASPNLPAPTASDQAKAAHYRKVLEFTGFNKKKALAHIRKEVTPIKPLDPTPLYSGFEDMPVFELPTEDDWEEGYKNGWEI